MQSRNLLMSGASWPAAAWKPREAKEGAACRESVSWADGAKRVRRCFPTQKAGLPLPSDHSLTHGKLSLFGRRRPVCASDMVLVPPIYERRARPDGPSAPASRAGGRGAAHEPRRRPSAAESRSSAASTRRTHLLQSGRVCRCHKRALCLHL